MTRTKKVMPEFYKRLKRKMAEKSLDDAIAESDSAFARHILAVSRSAILESMAQPRRMQ